MIKILGTSYYIDIEKFDEIVNVPSNTTGESENHISVVKFEILKAMLEVMLSYEDTIDEKLGLTNASLSIPFKLAFNTLTKHKILNSN